MATMIPDRGGWYERRPGSYMDEVKKVSKGDNPRWKCESCGERGAMDYAGQGRVCQTCATKRGF